jgi:hypothetical protein
MEFFRTRGVSTFLAYGFLGAYLGFFMLWYGSGSVSIIDTVLHPFSVAFDSVLSLIFALLYLLFLPSVLTGTLIILAFALVLMNLYISAYGSLGNLASLAIPLLINALLWSIATYPMCRKWHLSQIKKVPSVLIVCDFYFHTS